MFKSPPPKRIGFEDVRKVVLNPAAYILINTLASDSQDTLIQTTVPWEREEAIINEMISDYNSPDRPIVIYGRNSCDVSVDTKYAQLRSLGITDIYIYAGGLFEWLLLHDIYGEDEFPIRTLKPPDILRFRVSGVFS